MSKQDMLKKEKNIQKYRSGSSAANITTAIPAATH
jgi:hypothetical protein